MSCSYAKQRANKAMKISIADMNAYNKCTHTSQSCKEDLQESKQSLVEFQQAARKAAEICGNYTLTSDLQVKHDCTATKERIAYRKRKGGFAQPDVEFRWYRAHCSRK